MDTTPLIGWYVRGLGGLTNMLAKIESDGYITNVHWILELEKESEKLCRLVEKLKVDQAVP